MWMKAKHFNAMRLLKKTAIGSLVGATVLGTLPATIGITHAEAEPTPLVEKGGMQPYLQALVVGSPQLNQPKAMVVTTVPSNQNSNESVRIIAHSNYDDDGATELHIEKDTIHGSSFEFASEVLNSNEDTLIIKDMVIGQHLSDDSLNYSGPVIYGTAENSRDLSSNVYAVDIQDIGNGMPTTPLLAPGEISNPQGIGMGRDGTLYVAGGSDKSIWKLVPNTNDTDNDSIPTTDSINDNDSNNHSDNDVDSGIEGSETGTGSEGTTNSDNGTSTEGEEIPGDQVVTGSHEFDALNGSLRAPYTSELVKQFPDSGYLADVVFDGTYFYVSDSKMDRVIKVDQSGRETNISGDFRNPASLALDNAGNLYITDTGNDQIKKVNAGTNLAYTIAGSGEYTSTSYDLPAVQYPLTNPQSVAIDPATDEVYIADTGANIIGKLVDKFFYKQIRENETVWNLVENVEGLDHIRDNLDGSYRLTTDITIDSKTHPASANTVSSWAPIGRNSEMPFIGDFDGAGHIISGLNTSSEISDLYDGGLFGHISEASVENVSLKNVNYDVWGSAGGLAASAKFSRISKVSVEGQVKGQEFVGGLIGHMVDTSVKQSYFHGKLQSSGVAGGLIGSLFIGNVANVRKVENSYAWSEIDDRSYNQRKIGGMTGGIVGLVEYEYDSNANVIQVPIIFENTYASTEFTGQLPSLVPSSEVQLGGPFEGEAFNMGMIQNLASNYWDSTFPSKAESKLAKKLTTEQMKNKASFDGWDFEKIWTLQTKDSKRGGYPTLKAFAKDQTPTTPTTPTVPTTPTPSNPSTGGGTSAPAPSAPAAPSNTTTINVNVQNNKASNGSVVASLAITRTRGNDGALKDQLQLTPAKAKEIIDLLKTSGSKTAAIVLPDSADEISEWNVNVPREASNTLVGEGVELVILNPNVRISVPASSLTDLADDLYFRLIPVKSTATSSEIQSRALANQEIVTAANGGDITVVGRPMTIETNLQSRPVTLTLPLPEGSSFTAAQQKKLGVYIEHSDGTKQLVAGKVVTQEDGKQGLEITVNHFSTFTIVNVSNWGSSLITSPYIMGYANGGFKPAQNITRAELAAIVGRITGMTEGAAAFSDVKNGSWASTVVGPAAASGIMTGYSNGTFKPNASITRGELAAALAKLLPQSGLDASIQAAGFSDLAANHWAAAPAAELQAAGVVTGYADGSFKPEQNVTRAEAVTMINRLIGLDGSTALPGAASWNDVADTYWAYDAVRAASMQR